MARVTLSVSILFWSMACAPFLANTAARDSGAPPSQRWNEAFGAKNAKLLEGILAEDFHFASAGGKCSTSQACIEAFASLIRKRPDLIWENHPSDVQMNHEWKVAYESGDWIERWTEPDGSAEIRGRYFAMWKQKDGFWILHAMISTPLSCSGESGYCRPKS